MRRKGAYRDQSNAKIPAKDRCQTPVYAVAPIVKYIPRGAVIWEPAAGEGIVARYLIGCGFRVIQSDIRDERANVIKIDFLKTTESPYKAKRGEIYHVTNPPFSLKYKWLARAYEMGLPFLLLVPVATLGAAAAQKLFQEYGVTLIFLDKRVNFKMPNMGWDGGGGTFPVMWLQWDGVKRKGRVKTIFESIVYTEPE